MTVSSAIVQAPPVAALAEYADAWLEEARFVAEKERLGEQIAFSVWADPPQRNEEWAPLLARKEAACEALGCRDYHDAQILAFEALLDALRDKQPTGGDS